MWVTGHTLDGKVITVNMAYIVAFGDTESPITKSVPATFMEYVGSQGTSYLAGHHEKELREALCGRGDERHLNLAGDDGALKSDSYDYNL